SLTRTLQHTKGLRSILSRNVPRPLRQGKNPQVIKMMTLKEGVISQSHLLKPYLYHYIHTTQHVYSPYMPSNMYIAPCTLHHMHIATYKARRHIGMVEGLTKSTRTLCLSKLTLLPNNSFQQVTDRFGLFGTAS